MANPVVHFEVVGKDGEALKGFYESLFGWTSQSVEGMSYHLIEKEEGGIGGGIGASPDGTTMATFYVQVEDPQAALDQAVALGGKVVMPVMTIPNMVTIALFGDPEGNVVGLVASTVPAL